MSLITSNIAAQKDIYTSEIPCNENVTIGFWIPDEGEEARKYKINDTTIARVKVSFLGSFNDTLLVYKNNELLESGRAVTSKVTGLADFGVLIDYSMDESLPFIKVVNKTRDICFEVRLIKGWRFLTISFYKNEWHLNYSNYLAVYE